MGLIKAFLVGVLIALASIGICWAEETPVNTDQSVVNKNSYLGINIEKKPVQENGKQTVKNERSFLFINIVINGKTPIIKE